MSALTGVAAARIVTSLIVLGLLCSYAYPLIDEYAQTENHPMLSYNHAMSYLPAFLKALFGVIAAACALAIRWSKGYTIKTNLFVISIALESYSIVQGVVQVMKSASEIEYGKEGLDYIKHEESIMWNEPSTKHDYITHEESTIRKIIVFMIAVIVDGLLGVAQIHISKMQLYKWQCPELENSRGRMEHSHQNPVPVTDMFKA